MLAGAGVSLPADGGTCKPKCNKKWNSAPEFAARLGGFAFARQSPFPGERVADNGVEVVELRAPVERRPHARDIGHQRGRIAGAPCRDCDRKIALADAPHRLDYLEYRSAVAVAAIECCACAVTPQIGKRRRMRARE